MAIDTSWKLPERIAELSSKPWPQAISEWRLRSISMLDPGEDSTHCLCGHVIRELCRIENQINGYGYRFLQQDKVPQAVRMFKANVDLFPDAWNVYDSLGEALVKAGDLMGAEKMYAKSVELKPDSKSGLEALQKIREAKAK